MARTNIYVSIIATTSLTPKMVHIRRRLRELDVQQNGETRSTVERIDRRLTVICASFFGEKTQNAEELMNLKIFYRRLLILCLQNNPFLLLLADKNL